MTAWRVPSKAVNWPLLKDRKPKVKKKSAAEKREGMCEKHLQLIRKLPCCVCGRTPGGQAHHLKLGVVSRGMGMRAPDKCTVPMCDDCHIHGIERAGSQNEFSWFIKKGVNPLDLAAALWFVTGNADKMLEALLRHLAQQEARS